jgi:hypothetical protein
MVTTLQPQGMEIIANSPDEMSAILKADTEQWGNLVQNMGVKLAP